MDLYNPDFLSDRVFQGIWRRYKNAEFSQLILTLSFYKALVVIAVLVILIEYGGSRVWVIMRFIVSKIVWKPVQFDDPIPDRLLQLSRGRAVMNTFVSIEKAVHWLLQFKKRSGSNPDLESGNQHDPGQSAWYGIASLANIITFLFLGIALPVFLTEGVFGPPIVKSRPLLQCLSNEDGYSKIKAFVNYAGALQKADSIFGLCGNLLEESCFRDYHFVPPQIRKRRLDYCPFPGPVCDNRTKPLEITHLNMTAYELGINSPSKLSFSHRTTCVPVITEGFMLWKRDFSRSHVSARTTLDEPFGNHTLVDNFIVELSTPNGPNIASKNSSGLDAASKNRPSAINVIPTVDGTIITSDKYEGWDYVHQDIRRDDGNSFLIVHRAGRIPYNRPVNDPFFAAHNTIEGINVSGNDSAYFADYEATTMACVDQYQFCIPGREKLPYCSDWGNGDDIMVIVLALFMEYFDTPYKDLAELVKSILKTEGQSIMDAVTFVPAAVRTMSLHQTLALRNRMIPESGLLRDQFASVRRNYVDEQWILEVETWFMKAILDTLFRVKVGAKFTFSGGINSYLISTLGSHILVDWSTCGRVLFRNANYTNINFIGFCSVLGVILILCITSYQIERIFNAGKFTVTSVRHTKRTYASIKTSLTDCITKVQLLRRSTFSTFSSFQPSVWFSLVQSQPHMRTWPQGNQHRGPSTETGPGCGQQVQVDGGSDPQQGMEDINMDDIDAANLRQGEDIDDPPDSRGVFCTEYTSHMEV